VLQVSLGDYGETTNGLHEWTKLMDNVVYSGNSLAVSAAGNNGSDNPNRKIAVPADSYNTITVGATSRFQNWDFIKIGDGSARAPTDDGRTKIDVVAPVGGYSTNEDWEGEV